MTILIILMDEQGGLDESKRNSYALHARQSRLEFFVTQSIHLLDALASNRVGSSFRSFDSSRLVASTAT